MPGNAHGTAASAAFGPARPRVRAGAGGSPSSRVGEGRSTRRIDDSEGYRLLDQYESFEADGASWTDYTTQVIGEEYDWASPHITTRVEGHVLQIGVNRPEKRNAFTREMNTALAEAYHQLATDENIEASPKDRKRKWLAKS